MAPRRTSRTIIENEETPLDEAMREDQQRIASDLSAALESLGEFTDTGTTFKVFKLPRGSGKFEWCFDITPPFNSSELMEELREKYGPGDYCIRVYVAGQSGLKAQRNFSIAGIKTPMVQHNSGSDLKDVLPLLIGQMNSSKSDMMAMMQMQMQMQQAAQQQQQAATQQNTQMMLGLVTAMMGAREKPAELIAAFAPLMAPKSGGFGEVVEIIKAVKELGGNSSGGDDDSLMGIAKMVAPAIPDLAKSIAGALPRRQQETQEVRILPQAGNGATPPNASPQLAAPVEGGRFPLLAAIREDVLFYFRRGHDPEFAADGVYEVLEKAGLNENDLAPIVAAFLASPNWLDELAAEGIDLRENPVWAQQFLNSLIALYNGENDDPEREGGSGADLENHGGFGEEGSTVDQGQDQGA